MYRSIKNVSCGATVLAICALGLTHSGVIARAQESPDESNLDSDGMLTNEAASQYLIDLEFGEPEVQKKASLLLRYARPDILGQLERLILADDQATAQLALEVRRHVRWKPVGELRSYIGSFMDDFEARGPSEWETPPGGTFGGHLDPYDHGDDSANPFANVPDYKSRPMMVDRMVIRGKKLAVPFLVRMIEDRRCWDVAPCAWGGLLKYAGPNEIAVMLRQIDRPNPPYRRAAMLTLVRIDIGSGLNKALKELDKNRDDLECLEALAKATSLEFSAQDAMLHAKDDLTRIPRELIEGRAECKVYRALIVRNLVLRDVLGAEWLDPLRKCRDANGAKGCGETRKYLNLALAKLNAPEVLDELLSVKEIVTEQSQGEGEDGRRAIEAVVLTYLRAQSDPRAVDALLKYR